MKKILVTGSSSGIGLEIAKGFANEHNCTIALNGRNAKKLKKASKNFKNVIVEKGDISKISVAKKITKNILKKMGGLDILVCNVGSGKSSKPGKENYLDWEKSLRLNFFSAINIINETKNALIKSKGCIVCISSICGIEYVEGAPITYSVAKSALNSFVKFYSKILGPKGVRINAIAPGNIMFKGSTWDKKIKKNKSKTLRAIKQHVSLKKFGTTKNISDICLFLTSKKGAFVTGSIWVVDGGQLKSI